MRIPAIHSRALSIACHAIAACAFAGSAAYAQRVQFPATPPGPTPYGGTSVYPSAPAGSSVYPAAPSGSSVYPAAPAGTPVYPAAPAPTYPATPQLSLPSYPAIPAAPAYDPYANPALGAPPVDVPYAASPYGAPPPSVVGAPYPSTPATATGSTLFEHGPTPQWSNSATYNQLNPDGTVQRLQRFLQQISVEHTYLYGDDAFDDLEINRTEIAATFGVPIFYNPHTPLLITPGVAVNWLEGPSGPDADLPPRLYDVYVDAAWYPRFSPTIGADLGVRTGVFTDFQVVNADSVRILGRALGVITLSPRMDLLAGAWYIDRNDIKLLPAGGVHWKPNTEWDAYLVFPNPKVRKRFKNIGSSQWWWYVAGEYGAGGGRWTVERDPAGVAMGADDDIDINDIRVIGGFEWETATQARGHIEAGYVFDREIIYDGTRLPPQFDLEDTFMIRLGFDF